MLTLTSLMLRSVSLAVGSHPVSSVGLGILTLIIVVGWLSATTIGTWAYFASEGKPDA
jgi:hypothetical protein